MTDRTPYWIEVDGVAVPATLEQWAATRSRCHVGDDQAGGYRVSTVFLGIDHAFPSGELPVLYETMVFGAGEYDQWYDRYHTRAEAAAGHARVLAALACGGALPGDEE